LLVGPLWHDNDLVFATAEGEPVHPSNVARSLSGPIKASGVRHIRFHELRHTHAR